MNTIKKLLALILALALVFSLTACSNTEQKGSVFDTPKSEGSTEASSATTTEAPASETTASPVTTAETSATEQTTAAPSVGDPFAAIGNPALDDSVAGTWVGIMDYGKMMEASQEEMAQLGEMGEAMMTALEGVTMDVVLDLHDDGSFLFGIDEASAREAVEAMMPALVDALIPMMISMSGMSEEDFAKQLEQEGMTEEAFKQQLMTQIDPDALVENLASNLMTGSWRFLDGKLYLVADGESVDPERYMAIELAGDKLTMTEIHSSADDADENEAYKAMLPLEFTRK